MKDTLKKILTGALILGSLGGCSKNEAFYKEGNFRGYKAIIGCDGEGRKINIYDNEGRLFGLDEGGNEGDGRFDRINLSTVPKGHPLEKYANPDSLEVAYNQIKNQGENK